ncbi:MAG: Gfo/Idh/MocA family oxidoreductase [Thermoguttaceae bacterium]|nr:Gfo/Idh/MocA family oxidoreductase [Thermoguttaceae bacterium]
MKRRHFLQSAAGAAAALTLGRFPKLRGEEPPRLRMGAIGVGAQGYWNARELAELTDMAAVCDLDLDYVLGKALEDKKITRKQGEERILPEVYSDYRRILDRDDIDAVVIATPDHWHTKIAVEALQAGKHVYCQKPLTLTLAENLLFEKAVEKYPDRVVQVGTQRRTFKQTMQAALLVRGGYLGDIQKITCVLGEGRESGHLQKFPVPGKLDWNTWVGQAPMRDYLASSAEPGTYWKEVKQLDIALPDQSNAHVTFRWWHAFSGGKFTDWGAHLVDLALWAVNRQTPGTGPSLIDSSGAKFIVPHKDGYPVEDNIYQTAITFDTKCVFPAVGEHPALEMRLISTSPEKEGVLFEGTKGRIHISDGRIKGKLIEEGAADQFKDEDYIALYNGLPVENHFRNFVRCASGGGKPISDVPTHVQALNVCHLAAISSRLNRPIEWDDAKRQIVGDEQAASFFARDQRKGFELPEV